VQTAPRQKFRGLPLQPSIEHCSCDASRFIAPIP
jgi:hypothetical protein